MHWLSLHDIPLLHIVIPSVILGPQDSYNIFISTEIHTYTIQDHVRETLFVVSALFDVLSSFMHLLTKKSKKNEH